MSTCQGDRDEPGEWGDGMTLLGAFLLALCAAVLLFALALAQASQGRLGL